MLAQRHSDAEAHIEEDDLYEEILKSIADGTAVDGATMARLAVTSKGLKFGRWYE